MKKTSTILIILPLLLAMIACNDPKPVTDTLHRAEALMNEYPDSAWTMLNTLSPDEMGQNSTRAHYALLYTQAQDKNYIDEANDSLITVAVDYYRDTDDARHRFLSYYYKGRVLANVEDYLNAMTCYMEAEQLADEVGDDYLVGLLYAELGRIYRLYYDYPKSLEAHQKAAECYERAGKVQHRNYMWLNQSSIYRNMNESEESERLLRMALEAGKEEEDVTLIELCLGDLVMLYVEQGSMSKARGYYDELNIGIHEDFGSPSFMGKLAQLYASERNFVLANECLEKGWKQAVERIDSVALYIASSYVSNLQGNGELAYQELMKGVLIQNQDAYQVLQQPVLTAQRDYLSEKLEVEAYLRQMEERLNLLSGLFFALLLGVSVYVSVRILKKHKKKARQVISHLESENKRVEEEKSKIALALQKLDEDKKNADQTIAMLREEIDKKKEENHAKIVELKVKLQKEQQSVEDLKRTLVQSKENSEAKISSLLEKLEQERTVAHQMIQAQNDVIAQKEENRKKMEMLVVQLEEDSKLNAESMLRLRCNLEMQEKEYHLYVQQANTEVKALQDENRKMIIQKVELLKTVLEHVANVVILHEAKYLKAETKEKKIKEGIGLLKKEYFAGKGEYKKVESLVNLYLDNVMVHFRKEVSLANESEYRRVCYLFAGVSGQVIGEIMKESKEVVYQRKSRLLKKIASLPCENKEKFIMLLAK